MAAFGIIEHVGEASFALRASVAKGEVSCLEHDRDMCFGIQSRECSGCV